MSTAGILAKGVFSRQFWTRRRVGIVAGIIVAVISTVVITRTQLAIVPTYETQNHKVDAPFVIALNQYTKSVDIDAIRVVPVVSGTWSIQEGTLLGGDRITFTPTDYFAVNTTYTVTLPSIERVIAGTAASQSLQFATEQAPSPSDEGIARLANKQTIPADYNFPLTLSSPNRGLRNLELRTTPQLAMVKTEATNGRTFTWKSGGLLPQGEAVSIEVFDTKNNVTLLKKTVMVASEPKLIAPEKATHYRPGDTITLGFSEAIAKNQDEHIAFDAPGEGTWKDQSTYVFTPSDVKPGQTYRYTIAAGIRSVEGGISGAEQVGEVTSVGPVRAIRMTPQGRELSQASQRISFTFDQPVNKQSAIDRLSVSSGTIERTEWSGDTLTATVKDLGFQRTVTTTIGSGVKNASFGQPSNTPFSVSFTTEVRSRKLAVPYYSQQHAASCTAASLRMALAYRGTTIGSDMAIVQQMGYNPRPIDKSTDPATWDDPNSMFVGDVNGSIKGGTGAGPDAQPVAKASRNLGRNASAVRGIGVAWVAQQIYDGNPVVLFGGINGSDYIEWRTPSGAMTRMHVTGHARTVTGVVGEPSNPIGFWVNDPLYGKQYWTAGSLAANINLDPYRQAVVVY